MRAWAQRPAAHAVIHTEIKYKVVLKEKPRNNSFYSRLKRILINTDHK